MKMIANALMAILLLILALGAITGCACDDDDDDDDDSGLEEDDDSTDDDDSAADDDDDDDSAFPVVNCIPPLDYDGDGDAELLLDVWAPDENMIRLYLVDPTNYERGEPILEYDVADGEGAFNTADFDGNGVWDFMATITLSEDGIHHFTHRDIYLNGSFSAPAYTIGPYADVSGDFWLLDNDGNDLPELLVSTSEEVKDGELEYAYRLFDTDNDFGELFAFTQPDDLEPDNLEFVPIKRIGAVWPAAGSVSGDFESPELPAYAQYQTGSSYYQKLYLFDAATGQISFESTPYSNGDVYNHCPAYAGDVDGDGKTEVLTEVIEETEIPVTLTSTTTIFGQPDMAVEWTGGQVDGSKIWISLSTDYDQDGVLNPTLSRTRAADNMRQITVLNGPAGYTELFELQYEDDDRHTLLPRIGRGYLEMGYDFRGQGAEVFVHHRSVEGSTATGELKSITMSDGALSGVLADFNLAEDGWMSASVLDLGGDDTLDIVVLYNGKYQSGGGWADDYHIEVLAAPDFQEVLHEPLDNNFSYSLITELDLTGDLVSDLVLYRRDKTTDHYDFLLFSCDSTGCDNPDQIDFGQTEMFYFTGPML